MAAHRADERRQAAWQIEVKAASGQVGAAASPALEPSTGGVHLFPDVRLPVHERNLAQPVVVMPQVEDPSVAALRLQVREEAAERVHLRKAAVQQRPGRVGGGSRDERRRLEAAQQSRRDDQRRLDAAQFSRRQDQSRLEAAQQSRREDQARLEAAQAERRRQH